MTPGMALRDIEQLLTELDLSQTQRDSVALDLDRLWDYVLLGR